MSIRSLNGLSTNNVRSLNGLEGIGIESIVGGDAIAITTATGSRTINVDISKQTATSSIADTDLFLLETSSGVIKKITGANLKSESDTNFWSRSGGFIQPSTQTDKLQLFSSITNDTDAGSTFFDILTFKNTTSNSALATFKYQINDNSTNSTSNAKFKMVHFDDNTNTTTDIYSVDTSSILTFSKRLTLTNGLKQGSFNYTMPSSSGTLALQSELDDIWTRSSTNIQQTNTNDTLTLDYQADATYKDTLLIKNTNAGTDILTYKYQIKDNGSLDAKLNFKVDYSRGGGTSIDVFDITYDGFLQVKKRLDVANGFFANSGEEYNFLSTGGTLANTNFFSGTSPITYNSSTGAIGTTFTPTSTTNMSGKTFTDMPVCNVGIGVKQTANTTSGNVRFFDKDNSNFIDLHIENETVASNINVFLPNSVNNTVLVGRNTADTLLNKTITSFTGNSSATITTPSTTGTLAIANATHTSKWNDSSNIYTPTNSSLTSIDLPQNTKIRDANDTNDFIQFKDNIFHIDYFTIDIRDTCNIRNASNTTNTVLSIQNGYFLFQADSILFKQGLKMTNSSDSTNDYFQFNDDNLYFNYANLDFIEGIKLRNASDTTNDFISFRNNHLYINYAITEVIQGGKIANGSDPTNDFIQFNDNNLYINYANVDLKLGTNIRSNFDTTNDYITFDNDFLYINYNHIDLKQGSQIRNFSNVDDYIEFSNGKTLLNSEKVEMVDSGDLSDTKLIGFGRNGDYLFVYCPADTSTIGGAPSFTQSVYGVHKNGSVVFFNTTSSYLNGTTNYYSFAYQSDQQARITMNGIAQISDEWVDNDDPSDRRLKYDIKDYENATQVINKIKIKSFMKYRVKNFNNDEKGNMLPFKDRLGESKYSIGVIAQEIYEIPELKFMVRQSDFNDIEPAYIHDWKPIIALLVKSNQEQQEEKNKMKKEIDTLKNEVEILKEFMNELITSKSFADFKKKIS